MNYYTEATWFPFDVFPIIAQAAEPQALGKWSTLAKIFNAFIQKDTQENQNYWGFFLKHDYEEIYNQKDIDEQKKDHQTPTLFLKERYCMHYQAEKHLYRGA